MARQNGKSPFVAIKGLPAPLPLHPVPWYLRWISGSDWRYLDGYRWVYLSRADYRKLFSR